MQVTHTQVVDGSSVAKSKASPRSMMVQPGMGMPLVLRGGNQNSASMMCTAEGQAMGAVGDGCRAA